MTSEKVFMRMATAEDAKKFYGDRPMRSMRAYVAVSRDSNEPIAIGGIYYEDGALVAFSEMKDQMRRNKKAIAIGIRMIMHMIETKGITTMAMCNNEKSMALLRKLGFNRVCSTLKGELMIWNKQGL